MRGVAGARIWYQSLTDPDADGPYFTRLGRYLRSVSSPGCEVEVFGIQPGDRYLHPITEFRCAAQVIANALTAQRQGYDAFVIGHFQEPGLAEARSAVPIPVIGLGEATMLHACTLGRKIGLVTINPVFVPYHEDQIARHGLRRRVIAVQAVHAQTGQFNRAFEDEREYRSLREAFVGQAEPMLKLGIDVIIPAGGYPMLLFSREQSFAVGGAAVLNGLPVAVAAAETAIGLRRLNGTGTSRRTAYALPPSEAVTEFSNAFTTPPRRTGLPTGNRNTSARAATGGCVAGCDPADVPLLLGVQAATSTAPARAVARRSQTQMAGRQRCKVQAYRCSSTRTRHTPASRSQAWLPTGPPASPAASPTRALRPAQRRETAPLTNRPCL